MTEGIWIAIITQAGAFVLAVIGMWRKLGRIDDQTTNSHTATKYPNLRDELTATREAIEAQAEIIETIAQTTTGHENRLARTETHLSDVARMLQQTHTFLDITRNSTDQRLDRIIADRDVAIRDQEARLRAYIDSEIAKTAATQQKEQNHEPAK